MAVDLSWLPQGTPFGKLPLGMRVNNPGNIKYFKGLSYPGMLGPSGPGHTDQGDPQMTFDSPQSGFNAMSSLAMKKYKSGKRTAMDLIAGQRGWTPGNTAAAANVARSMGIDPNADLNLVDPQRMTAFLRALTSQEHGASSKLYGDDLYTNAATYAINGAPPGTAAPASTYVAKNAVNEVTNNGAPMATPIGGAPIAGGPVPLNPPSQRKSKLAEALLASGAGAKPKNWGDLLNAAGDLTLGYVLGDKHDTQEKEYRGKLAEALAGSTNDTLATTLIGSGDPELMQSGVSLKVAQAKENAPLRGKDRFMPLPNGDVLDLTTMAPVPGIAPKQELTNDMREYAFSMKQRKEQGQPLVPFDEWAKTMKPNTANRVPSGYRETPDGRLEFIPGGPADPATKSKEGNVTEGAAKAANFANMMDKSEAELTKLAPVGPDGKPDPSKLQNPMGFWGQLREGLTPESAANYMRSPEYQQYRQGAMQWIRAKLRKESGATISPDEFEGEFRTFFPQPGDDQKVIEQKRQARAQALEGMKAESRGSFDQMFPATPNPDQPTPVKTQTIDPRSGQVAAPPGAAPAAPKAAPPPPPAAIDMLRSNPTPQTRQQFDEIFGPGAADRVLGAPAAPVVPQHQMGIDTAGTMMGF